MDYKELRELIRILEESGLNEIEVEEEGRRIRLQKQGPYAAPQTPSENPNPSARSTSISELTGGAAAESAGIEAETDGLSTIDSPMVGTFYRAPAPGEEPFVKLGDRVEESQTVCIIEAMKLMNEVGSRFAGIIEKILVENGQPVEFGQPLFAVRALE